MTPGVVIYEAEQCWNSLWMDDVLRRARRNPTEFITRAAMRCDQGAGRVSMEERTARWQAARILSELTSQEAGAA